MGIKLCSPSITDREVEYVTDAVRSGWVSSIGPYVEKFEQAICQAVGCKYATCVSSGTAALHLALHCLGIGPGDEVIVPDLTFVASANAVLLCGAEPVFVDVSPRTWCLDPAALSFAWSPKVKAIMPVHLFGHPCNMSSVMDAADSWKATVVEDCAEATLAQWSGKNVGTFGKAGCFSFYGNKIVTTGEGGVITTDDFDLAVKLKACRGHFPAVGKPYYHPGMGFNYRMTNLQAALGVAQFERVSDMLGYRQSVLQWYKERLVGKSGIEMNPMSLGANTVVWMSCALFASAEQRAKAERALKEAGIETRPFFIPIHRMPHTTKFRRVAADGSPRTCPVANDLSKRGLCLPTDATITEAEVDLVCETILKAI